MTLPRNTRTMNTIRLKKNKRNVFEIIAKHSSQKDLKIFIDGRRRRRNIITMATE